MTTPPRVTADQLADAVYGIHERHRRCGDQNRGELTEEPAEILSYLRKHWTQFPDGIRCDDLDDAVVLHQWLRWEASHREMWLFDQAVYLHVNRLEFVAPFGIQSPAGFNNRRDRLHQLHDETGAGRPDEKAAMSDRRLTGAPPAADWYAANRQPMRELARLAVALEPRVDDETADVLSEVGEELNGDRWDDTAFGVLTLAVQYLTDLEDLADSPEITDIRNRYVALRADRKRAESEPT